VIALLVGVGSFAALVSDNLITSLMLKRAMRNSSSQI